jgi:hypothetical protein
MRYNKGSLQKIEDLLTELGYTVRYEKGNFRAGHCLVEQRKIIVISKFYELEERMNAMLDILSKVEIDRATLSEANLKTLENAFKHQDDREDAKEAKETEIAKEILTETVKETETTA